LSIIKSPDCIQKIYESIKRLFIYNFSCFSGTSNFLKHYTVYFIKQKLFQIMDDK